MTAHTWKADRLTVELDASGLLAGLAYDGMPLLRALASFSIEEPGHPGAGQLDVRYDIRRLDGRALAWMVTLANHDARRRELHLNLDLPLADGHQLFCPASRARPDPHELISFGFRAPGEPITIPFVSLYGTAGGLTLFASLDLPIRPFQVVQSCGPGHDVRIRRPYVRLEPGQSLTLDLGLFAHGGDWRPGLGYLTERYRAIFYTDFLRVDDYYGAFVYSSLAPQRLMERWADEGVGAVEVHYTYPYFGKLAPDGAPGDASGDVPYTRAVDDWWAYAKRDADPLKPSAAASFAEIMAYVERTAPKNGSLSATQAMLSGLRAHNLRSLIYYNPHDCWDVLARERYADAIVRGRDGSPHVDWFEQHIMNARPDADWGRHVRAEFRRLLRLLPGVDGVFMDQFTFDQLDFSAGADDGWSIEDGRVAYRMGHAECLLAAELAQHARGLGKFLWWNGPYSADIARFADGMMAEGGGAQGERIQYLTAGNKPTCCLALSEYQYKRDLTLGLWPTPPSFLFAWRTMLNTIADELNWSPPDEVSDLYERYRPLFEQFRGKTWLLTAQPVTVPEGIEANAFTTPGDASSLCNTLITLAVMDQDLRSHAFRWRVPITLRLPQPEAVHAVYLLTPDTRGLCKLPFERDGDLIHLTLPRLRSACMLIAARQGAYVALQSPQNVPAGDRNADLSYSFDNWTDETLSMQLRGTEQAGVAPAAVTIAPRSSHLHVTSATLVPAGEHTEWRAQSLIGNRMQMEHWELWVDESIGISWLGRPALLAGQPAVLHARVANNTPAEMVIEVACESTSIQVSDVAARIHLPAGAAMSMAQTVTCNVAGQHALVWLARSVDGSHATRVTMPVEVVRAAFRVHLDGSPVLPLSAHLRLDMLTPDGAPDIRYKDAEGVGRGTRNRPLRLNGITIGQVPARNNTFWRVDFTVPIPPEALAHVGLTNHVEIDPDSPEDAFAVRNLAVEVELPGGTRLSSRTDPRVYDSQANPGATLQTDLVFDSLQRRPRLNDDWNNEPVA